MDTVDSIIGISPEEWRIKRDRAARKLGKYWGDPLVEDEHLENGNVNFAYLFDKYQETYTLKPAKLSLKELR